MAWSKSGPYVYPSPYDGDFPVDKKSVLLAPVRGLAIGVVLGLCGWIALVLAHVGIDVWRRNLLDSMVAGDWVAQSILDAHDSAYRFSVLAQIGALVVVAVLFVVWSFRARANAEKISDRRHRWRRRWLVFAWLVPIGNLWWPKQLVDDIWLASDPRFTGASMWRRPWLVRAWWTAWLLYLGLDRLVDGISKPSSADLEGLSQAALNEIMVAPVGITAALLAIAVVWRLSRIQETRRREPDRVLAG